jgi:hypothetical protein
MTSGLSRSFLRRPNTSGVDAQGCQPEVSGRPRGVANHPPTHPTSPTLQVFSPSTEGDPIRRVAASSLLIVLDFADRTDHSLVRVLPRLLTCPSLAEQVPTLVERLLDTAQLCLLLRWVQLAALRTGTQLMFLVDQSLDLLKDLVLVHVTPRLGSPRNGTI